MESVFAVVLAGGSGTRFWPRSRQLNPKQLCRISDSKQTMLEDTLGRLDGLVPPSRRLVVTHHLQKEKTLGVVGKACAHVLAEPSAKNTAPALLLAALEIRLRSQNEDAVMLSLHADHAIQNVAGFQATMREAVQVARSGKMVLVGVPPTKPETGFGYIQRGEVLEFPGVHACYRVQAFKEKPSVALAQSYLAENRYYWNSGLFIWKVSTFCQEFERFLPSIWQTVYPVFERLRREGKSFQDLSFQEMQALYNLLPELAIDTGLLEKSRNIAVLASQFDWNDVGTWSALEEILPHDEYGNVVQGDALLVESEGCVVSSDGPFLAAYGVKDLIMIVDKGCVLVCPKDKALDVKTIVAMLKDRGRQDLI